MAVIEPESTPLTAPSAASPASPMLRSHDGDVSHAPAFLGRKTRAEVPVEAAPAAPAAASDSDAPAKPKRRRAPRVSEATSDSDDS